MFFFVCFFFQFERHCSDVNKDLVQYNITKYFGSKPLNMKTKTHFELISCFCDLDLDL